MLLQAGVTGKIAGKVTDKNTGAPLPGVNVVIVGTHLGAASDINGYYYILNVPPGVYTLKATMMGYKPVEIKNVVVIQDITTAVNIELEPTVIKITKPIIVTARRPLVRPDVTSTMHEVSHEEISRQVVHTTQGVVAQQPGVVSSAGGASGATGGLHIRGGRAAEVVYMVDGMSINDPIQGGMGADINVGSISQMEVLTGGFNAEYGQAMSGIVNIVTQTR